MWFPYILSYLWVLHFQEALVCRLLQAGSDGMLLYVFYSLFFIYFFYCDLLSPGWLHLEVTIHSKV